MNSLVHAAVGEPLDLPEPSEVVLNDGRRYLVFAPKKLPFSRWRIVQSDDGVVLAVPRGIKDPPQSKYFMIKHPRTKVMCSATMTQRAGLPVFITHDLRRDYDELRSAYCLLHNAYALLREEGRRGAKRKRT